MATTIRQQIEMSGKKTVVTYKGKDKRTSFDESVPQKKVELISKFIGDKSSILAKILNK